MEITINQSGLKAKKFGYDGCHKIYLIHSKKDEKELLEYGYDIFPISELKEKYNDSCPLRFISNADLQGENIVNQFDTAIFA